MGLVLLEHLKPFFLFSQAGKTLSERRWHAAFSQEGHLDIEKVLRRIQRGVNTFNSRCCFMLQQWETLLVRNFAIVFHVKTFKLEMQCSEHIFYGFLFPLSNNHFYHS